MDTAPIAELLKCEMSFDRPQDDILTIRITGNCKIGKELPSASEVQKQVEADSSIKKITFDTKDLAGWDSGLLTFLTKVIDQCSQNKIHADAKNAKLNIYRQAVYMRKPMLVSSAT